MMGGVGPWLPSSPTLLEQRGQVGEGNQAHIWKASGAPDVPGPRAPLRKGGGELGRPRSPPPLSGVRRRRGGAWACAQPGRLPQLVSISSSGPGSPQVGNPAQSWDRQVDDPISRPPPGRRPEAGGRRRQTDGPCLNRAATSALFSPYGMTWVSRCAVLPCAAQESPCLVTAYSLVSVVLLPPFHGRENQHPGFAFNYGFNNSRNVQWTPTVILRPNSESPTVYSHLAVWWDSQTQPSKAELQIHPPSPLLLQL